MTIIAKRSSLVISLLGNKKDINKKIEEIKDLGFRFNGISMKWECENYDFNTFSLLKQLYKKDIIIVK